MITVALTSILVDDQDRAERFYTKILGFQVKMDFPVGAYRWLTVVSPVAPDGVQVVLEPMAHEWARSFQTAMREAGAPATALQTDDIAAEYTRLTALGVVFTGPPTAAGPVTQAVLDDTCGNWIQLFQI
jgi:catechol 2,3-dioxygenase-like lactoylglutathione lyase family enzyme